MTDRVDVAVVGGGPAGLAAATVAAEQGASVCLIDAGQRPGGQIWRHREPASLTPPARRWCDRLTATTAVWLGRTEVIDANPDGTLRLSGPSGAAALTAGAIILATGARELLLPFPGWTLPNVVGAGGLQALVKDGAQLRDRRVVVAGSGPLLLPVAATLARHGARIVVVAEQAPPPRVRRFAWSLRSEPARLWQALTLRSAFAEAPYRPGVWVTRAAGDGRLRRVTLTDGRREWSEDCDYLAVGYGLVPSTELGLLLGCVLRTDGASGLAVGDRQQTSVPNVFAAGECAGIAGESVALAEGEIAALAALGRTLPPALARHRARGRALAARMTGAFALRPELRRLAEPDTIVCRCEDVTLGRFDPHWDRRAAKLYARVGMGPCQGRVCGAALEFMLGWPPDQVRPPVLPARCDAL